MNLVLYHFIIITLIITFSLELQNAYSTDSNSLGISLDPEIPIIGIPVTISCMHFFDHQYDILNMTRNSEVIFSESTTSTEMTFLTDDNITVTCTVNSDGNTDVIYTFAPIMLTDAPIITSLVYRDVDNDDQFSKYDTVSILFDSDTNEPPNENGRDKRYVDDLFTFSDTLSQLYKGEWTNPKTFLVTIEVIDTTIASLIIGKSTVTPNGGIPILSWDTTSQPSSATSPSLITSYDIIHEEFLSDTLAISDHITTSKTSHVNLADSISISDTVLTSLIHNVNLADSISISDDFAGFHIPVVVPPIVEPIVEPPKVPVEAPNVQPKTSSSGGSGRINVDVSALYHGDDPFFKSDIEVIPDVVPNIEESVVSVPEWFSDVISWYGEGEITDEEYFAVLEYLSNH